MAFFGATGAGGLGKTIYTVRELWHRYKHGRDIVSNTPLIDLRVKRVFPKQFWGGLFSLFQPRSEQIWVPVDPSTFGRSWAVGYIMKFDDLYNLDECECLIDEMGAWMPAHKHMAIPEEVRRFLAQDRREGVNIWWTHRTSRVFNVVLDSTIEIAEMDRYGPWIIATLVDPQNRAPNKRPLRKHFFVSPMLYDLYDTFARVGDGATGKGYGVGKRKLYAGAKQAAYYQCELPCVGGEVMGCKIRLRYEQKECLIRMFGLKSVGLYRWYEYSDIETRQERHMPGSPSIWFDGPSVVPGLSEPIDLTETWQLEEWK